MSYQNKSLVEELELDTLWALWGYTPGYYEEDECEKIVALFTSKKKAQDYLSKSYLAKSTRLASTRKVFRQSSVLFGCKMAWVEEYEEPHFIIDPEL